MENDTIQERYTLAMMKIWEIANGEAEASEPYRECFALMAEFMLKLDMVLGMQLRGELVHVPLEALRELNHKLYEDILPGRYEESFANPGYAAASLGRGKGPLLAAFYAQLRGGIAFAFESRMEDITIMAEALPRLCHLFSEGEPETRVVRDFLCRFHSGSADLALPFRVREQLDPELSFAKGIIMGSNLSDLRYLYWFGEHISDEELGTAAYLNSLPQELVDRMARTYTEGFRRGFKVMRRDLSKKSTVAIRYHLGFERMIRAAILQFRDMGLEPVLYRTAAWSIAQMPGKQSGWHGTPANRQYDYDHRYDQAVYFDSSVKERKLSLLEASYEACKELAARLAGPAVLETFGEEGFHPVNKPEALSLSRQQEEDMLAFSNESMQIVNHYVPGNETSFTMIAFPLPAIGEHYEEVFAETIRINNLDYEKYSSIQQRIIDILDQAASIHVTGRDGNETDITVRLHDLKDPKRQTNFENCVADVNIPLGEVFTSPVLEGTNGRLHVKKVYLCGIQFRNLRLEFADGKIVGYSCDNFADPAQGRKLIRQEVLKNHDTLPMGEFAIGTNTAAYAMAEKYQIAEKLPILIAEKMGPHFAVGDTCYSWSEDSPVYNPDGKEVIARDNEISMLRREDALKAYFGCHTDITLPYSELGDIYALCPDGRKLPVVLGGRFVADGAEELNREL